MRTITLHVGDRLKVLSHRPFNSGLKKGETVTIVAFNTGNEYKDIGKSCPVVETQYGEEWYTDLKQLFHHFKKETE